MRSVFAITVVLFLPFTTPPASAEEQWSAGEQWFVPQPAGDAGIVTPRAAAVRPRYSDSETNRSFGTADRIAADRISLNLPVSFAGTAAQPAAPSRKINPLAVSLPSDPEPMSLPADPVPIASLKPQPHIASPRLTFGVDAGASMANTDNPPVDVSVTVIGGDRSGPLPVTLGDHLPYAPPGDIRTPEHQFGLYADYKLITGMSSGSPPVSIGASFNLNTYEPATVSEEGTTGRDGLTGREAMAVLRIGF